MIKSYIVLGHGEEALVPRAEQDVVPPGCTLVLAEECGMSAILPSHIYKTITTSSYAPYFRSPVTNKALLESIFRRPLRIYREGQRMPKLSLTLLSAFSDMQDFVEPSGLMPIPIDNDVILKDPTGIAEERYFTPRSQAYKAFDGAVYPTDLKKMDIRAIRKHGGVDITQLGLFKKFPGVHFNLLCRSLPAEGDELTRLVASTAPEINPAFAVDLYGTVEDWLTTEAAASANPEKVARMRELVSKVMQRRRSSGEPLGPPEFDRVVNMILAKRTPEGEIRRAVSVLKPLDIYQRTERREGRTLLGTAAYVGNTTAIRVLREAGAPVNARDTAGKTALMIAVQSENMAAAEMLLDMEANITIRDPNGWTALMFACTGDIVTPLIPRLIDSSILNVADSGGDTALNIAAGYPYPEAVRMLLEAGADINLPNATGDTPLMTVCASAHDESADNLHGYTKSAELLIEAGATINHRNVTKHSALAYAVRARMDSIATLLIEKGARPKSWLALATVAQKHGMPRTEAAAIAAHEAGRSENRV